MNLAWFILIFPAAYLIGMVPTAFLLGWAFRNADRSYGPQEILAPLGTIFWPIGLPIAIVFTLLWPFIRIIYNVIYGTYELGKGQSDLHVGARTKKIFGRVGR